MPSAALLEKPALFVTRFWNLSSIMKLNAAEKCFCARIVVPFLSGVEIQKSSIFLFSRIIPGLVFETTYFEKAERRNLCSLWPF